MPEEPKQPRRLRRFLLIAGTLLFVVVAGAGAFIYVQTRAETASVPVFCERLALAQDLDKSFASLDPTTLGPQTGALQRALRVAPAEIKPQLARLTLFVEQLSDAVRAAPTNKRAALTQALADRQGEIDEISAAGRAVQDWSWANCGIALNETATTLPR